MKIHTNENTKQHKLNQIYLPRTILPLKYFIHLPMKMEPIVSSETPAIRTQTPGNYPKRNKLHLEHGESLKTRINEYLLQLYVFSPDSKNRVPAPNKKTDSTQIFCPLLMTQTKQLLKKQFEQKYKVVSNHRMTLRKLLSLDNLLKTHFPSPLVKNNNVEMPTCLLCDPNRVVAFVGSSSNVKAHGDARKGK